GRIALARGLHEDAIKCWQALDAARRASWQLEEPLRATVFLTALTALEKQQFADAASRLREAGRLGCRDRRLGGLLMLALVKEGQRQLQEAGTRNTLRSGQKPEEALAAAARLFDQAITSGCRQPEVAYLLAMAYKRQDKLREARETLRKNALPDAILSLRERRFADAEQELA